MRALGDEALLWRAPTELAAPATLDALATCLRVDLLSGVEEVVVGRGSVALRFDPLRVHAATVSAWFKTAADQARPIAAKHEAEALSVPVRFGGDAGPDLAEVAARLGLSEQALIEAQCTPTYTVAHLGFLPGFAYLDGLPARLQLARKDQPVARVAAGSLAIAGAQAAIYPAVSPGGWWLLGRTTLPLFDPHDLPRPARLTPGDTLRFVPA